MSANPISYQFDAPMGHRPVLSPEQRAKIRDILKSPSRFSAKFLQMPLWGVQAEIAESVATERRTAVKACHASGKTFDAAAIALWFLQRFEEAVVITTAPTWKQVEKLLWGEIAAALKRSKYPFPPALQTELWMGPKRYAYGVSTNVTKEDEGVKFQGEHAKNILIIIDEAPGVEPKIWQAVEGIMSAGNAHLLAIGNPTIASGPFYDAFTSKRDSWKTFTISVFDTPNFVDVEGKNEKERIDFLLEMTPDQLKFTPNEHLVNKFWAYEMIKEWGVEHPFVQARVLGKFPKQSDDSLLWLAWLEEAKIREAKKINNDKIVVGIDVAGPGEAETSFTARRGPNILKHIAWPVADPRGKICAELNEFGFDLGCVNVDCVGIGWGIYLHIKDHLKNVKACTVNPVNVGEAASDKEKFVNSKAEYYWGLRKRFQDGDITGLLDDKQMGQLATIRYEHNSRGQIVIESKEDMIKRGVKSPDRAESLMLAFAKASSLDVWSKL